MLARAIAMASIVGASAITLMCPCKTVNGCHKKEFLLLMASATGAFLVDNYG